MNLKATEIHRHLLKTFKLILEIIFSSSYLVMGLMRFRIMVMMILMVMWLMVVMQAMRMRMMTDIQVVLNPCAK